MPGVRRVVTPELMDDPGVDRDVLDRSLGYIRLVNRVLGGRSALLGSLRRWAGDWPKDRPIRLLDVGTGSADLPLAAVQWASGRGLDLRVTGIDIHETTLDLAREHLQATDPEAASRIELVQADAGELAERFEPKSFDCVHAGLFLHHLSEIRVLTVLRVMDRLARCAVVWNDLVRTRVGYAAIHLLTIGQPEIIRHDARVSVRAGFTRREAMDFAHRVGLERPDYAWNPLTHRFVLSSLKPGCEWGDRT